MYENSLEELQEERRQLFAKKYKEAFGTDIEFKAPMTDEEKLASGKYGIVLNYYGIKSEWA